MACGPVFNLSGASPVLPLLLDHLRLRPPPPPPLPTPSVSGCYSQIDQGVNFKATSQIFTSKPIWATRNKSKTTDEQILHQEVVPVFLVSEKVKENEVKRAVTTPRYNVDPTDSGIG